MRRTSEEQKATSSDDSEEANEADVLIKSRKGLRGPGPARPPEAPKIDTDEVLESLHTSLRQQMTVSPLMRVGDRSDSAASPVSGAMAKNAGRKHEESTDGKKKSGSKKKRKSVPPEVARSLAKTKEFLAASKAIGVDQPKARDDLKWGELALDAGEFKVAASCFRKADKRAKEVLSTKLPEVWRRSREEIRHLDKHRAITKDAKSLLEEAKAALDKGNYVDSIHAINEASKKIKEAEQEVILKVMFKAKEKLILAKKAGINIDRPLNLLKTSRERLKEGDFEEAIQFAEEGERVVEVSLKREHIGKRHLTECMRAIRTAELLGATTEELDKALDETMVLFKSEDLGRALDSAKELTSMAKKAAYDKAASTYEMADRGIGVAKKLGLEIPDADEMLSNARRGLERDDYVKSFSYSTSVIVETNAAIMDLLDERLRSVDQFAKGIEGEVMSLSEVQDAIEHTKERSLENFRKYAKMSEELVHQAFESAMSYTRVSQDVVKQAFNSSMAVNGAKPGADGALAPNGEVSAEIVATAGTSPEDKRLRIINLYLDGKITESQLERLLTLIDSSVAQMNLV